MISKTRLIRPCCEFKSVNRIVFLENEVNSSNDLFFTYSYYLSSLILNLIKMDDRCKKTLSSIPLLKTKAGPRDKDLWPQRLKEEYQSLIQYVQNNKAADNDWFRLESNKEGTRWFGKCWFIHNLLKYEFDVEFDIPVTYPATAVEIALPELDGKTAKMYRGGKICLSDHFKPLWARNTPKFGIAHAMALGLGPWLAVEIPDLIEKEVISYREKTSQ